MQRLTQKDDQGNWSLKGVTWESLYEGQVVTKELRERLYGALWKLMEYEDAGLTPEEVEQLKESGRWIPVEERLPEEDGEYLVTFLIDKKVCLVGYGCCRKDVLGNDIGFGWYDLYSGTYFSDKAFTAWMPLPEPYRPEH